MEIHFFYWRLWENWTTFERHFCVKHPDILLIFQQSQILIITSWRCCCLYQAQNAGDVDASFSQYALLDTKSLTIETSLRNSCQISNIVYQYAWPWPMSGLLLIMPISVASCPFGLTRRQSFVTFMCLLPLTQLFMRNQPCWFIDWRWCPSLAPDS